MNSFIIYILSLPLMVLIGLSPFPVLPIYLAAYLRFSYFAVPTVMLASLFIPVFQYVLGKRFLGKRSWIKKFSAQHKLPRPFNKLTLQTLVFIRLVGFVPSKIFNYGCGVFKVPFAPFTLSILPRLVIDQFIYLSGASILNQFEVFFPWIHDHGNHWLFMIAFYLIASFILSAILSYCTKHIYRLFRPDSFSV